MNDSLLKIEDLKVTYKTEDEIVEAVNNVSLQVERGKTLGIVGETGAGKTTAALSILRLLPEKTGIIERGSIVFNGKDLLKATDDEMRKIRGEKISMIFQDPMTSLNPVLTVGSQIGEVLELHSYANKDKHRINDRVDEILKMVGIPPQRKNEYPHQFSGGMKQRVVIAIALACEPELLIADEPTTALDVTIQAQVLDMMDDLKYKLNTSMMLITHDLGVVANICDNVAIMYAGEIIEYGTREDIYLSENRHPYTDGLFSSIPKLNDKSPRLHPIDGLMPDPTRLPQGCKFHPRCSKCMDVCQKKQPPAHSSGTHIIRCHLYSDKQEESE